MDESKKSAKLGKSVGKKIQNFPFRHFIFITFLVFLLIDCSFTDILCSLDTTVKLSIFAFAYVMIYVATKFL